MSLNVQGVILLATSNDNGSVTEDEHDDAFQLLGVEPSNEQTVAEKEEENENGPFV
jgi:hypothetical protein